MGNQKIRRSKKVRVRPPEAGRMSIKQRKEKYEHLARMKARRKRLGIDDPVISGG